MDSTSQFALIRGQEVTAWTMEAGQVMTGVLVRENSDTFTVVIPDGTTCDVPREDCHPATLDEVQEASVFLAEQNQEGPVSRFSSRLLGWLWTLLVIAGLVYAWWIFRDNIVTKIILSVLGIGFLLWRLAVRVAMEVE